MKTYKEFINETYSMSHEYVLGSLADKDINAHVKNGKIVVDKADTAKARAHLKKIGHDHIKVTHVGSGQVAESVELDELSTDLLANYKKKASKSASEADKVGDFKKGNKRFAGIIKATNKQFKNDVKEGIELDEVLDTHKGIQSYIKKSAEKRAELVKNDSITNPNHAETRRKLEKSNKGFDKAIEKHYKLNKEDLDETLSPDQGAGEYVKDFKKSDAPQFKGKSPEKRRQMGIAAYLNAKRNK